MVNNLQDEWKKTLSLRERVGKLVDLVSKGK